MNNHLTINSDNDRGKFISSKDPYPLPLNFEKMKELCQRFYEITKISFCRIDFYEINGNVYFGEYTFIPNQCNVLLNTKYEQFLIDKYNI
jgi:5-methylcytosine-specific restriction endonuclease McrBC regulatory subunit McrC